MLFRSPLGGDLVFKGGTSLSKAYNAIRRFSEDVDLTYDIRALAPDLVDGEQILIDYDPQSSGTGYVAPTVKLEFGARSMGEPWQARSIASDAAGHLAMLQFPTATARVMRIERTFWEKATAAHVYCLQGRLRSERFARHWSDLARLFELGHAALAARDRDVAARVARHKALFFSEKDEAGAVIDYESATSGGLRLVPSGPSREALRDDYSRMVDDGLFLDEALTFDSLMERCGALEVECNSAAS